MQKSEGSPVAIQSALDASRPYPEAVYYGRRGVMAVLEGPPIGGAIRWNVRMYYRRYGEKWYRVERHTTSTYHDTLEAALDTISGAGYPLDNGWIPG